MRRNSNPDVERWGLLTLMLLGPTVAACGAGDAPRRHPNIVFMLADDLGWADVGYQGSTFHKTPNIDALAARGLSFSNAYAPAPVCSPARAGFITGQSPARLQVTAVVKGRPHGLAPGAVQTGPKDKRIWEPVADEFLPENVLTLGSRLKQAGYRTALIGKWHLGNDPTELGFDVLHGSIRLGELSSYFSPYKVGRLADGPKGECITDRLANEAITFMEESGDQPFFLFLSFFSPHSPFQADRKVIEKYAARVDPKAPQHNPIYAAMIESLDSNVGRVLAALDRLGIRDQTFVLFASDHGGLEGIRARGNMTEPYHVTSNLPLRSGKGRLYEGGIRIPMIVAGAGVARVGEVSDVPVVGMDYLPTFSSLAGLAPLGPNAVCDGVDISSLFLEKGSLPERNLYFHFPHQSFASSVRSGNMKLIHFYIRSRDELYDLDADPGELHDIAGQNPELTSRLNAELFAWLENSGAALPKLNPNYEK